MNGIQEVEGSIPFSSTKNQWLNLNMETSTNKKPGLFYLYILKSIKDGSFYIGQCCNLSERLSRHNSGYNISTKAKKPWELVYFEEHRTRSEAVKRERELKKQKSHKHIGKLIFNKS